jgi:hypothetical protein
MRVRAQRIRRTVAGLALALFVAAFLGVYVQLASGHDPALDAAAKRQASVSSTSTSHKRAEVKSESSSEASESTTGEESSSTEASTSEGTTESSGRSEAGSSSAVTTHQS